MQPPSSGPLAGLRVLDCGTAIVGPWSATLLSFLGADAIKVERPSGEITRLARPQQNGWSTAYTIANLCKRSIELDFKDSANKQVIGRLLSEADVVIENYRPGVADRIGIGYEAAKRANPDVVYGSSSGWGDVGPMRDMSAVDSHLQAFSGFAALNGAPGGDPEMLRYTHIDPSGGTFLAAGVLLGLIGRERFGSGAHVVTSHLAMTLAMQASRIAETLETNERVPRLGSACTASVPNQCFKTQDGAYIAVTAQTPAEWEGFCRALGASDWLEDGRFKTNKDRVANRAALVGMIYDRIKSRPLRWWTIQFDKEGVPASKPFDIGELLHHDHIRENDMLVEVEPEHTGAMLSGGLPWKFSRTPAGIARHTPTPGSDTESVKVNGFGGSDSDNKAVPGGDGEKRPLQGIRVIELCEGYAGPHVGLLMAEAGADVTKVEWGDGDWSRQLTPHNRDGTSALFTALNRNKKFVRADFSKPADKARIVQNLADADLVIVDWTPDRADPVRQLLAGAKSEGIIILSLSWYGEEGSLSAKRGSELTVQAMTGYLRALGTLDGEPVRVGADIAESAATGMGLLGALAALFHREKTGEGQTVSVSRLGALMSLRSLQWAAISNPDDWLGPSYCLAETDRPRHGYHTRDTNIFVSMMNLRDDKNFFKMLEDLEMLPDVQADERFMKEGRTTIGMGFLSSEYHSLWEKYLTRFESEKVLEVFNAHGGTAVPFPELDDLMVHPQVGALNLVDEVGDRRYLRAPWRGPWTMPDVAPVDADCDAPEEILNSVAGA
jgi:crotonobetainyl-CoA:carnitine CoA-transferase CaiB-like acyl-CoA transferase